MRSAGCVVQDGQCSSTQTRGRRTEQNADRAALAGVQHRVAGSQAGEVEVWTEVEGRREGQRCGAAVGHGDELRWARGPQELRAEDEGPRKAQRWAATIRGARAGLRVVAHPSPQVFVGDAMPVPESGTT